MLEFRQSFVDGQWVDLISSDSVDVIHSATEAVIGRIGLGGEADIDRAVSAARAAFNPWSQTLPAERAFHLQNLRDALRNQQEELARLISCEVGAPIRMSRSVQVGLPVRVLDSYVELLQSFAFEEEVGNSLIVREPIGVVGCITPWNFPLHQVVAKLAAALAAGCTVVVKPSEVAPLAVFKLAEIIAASDLPAGVFNLVGGLGPVAGEALARHPDVDMISFTGSTRAGRRVAELAAPTVKRVAQELGGKSANLLLPDADVDRAVRHGVNNCFFNAGQTCSAWTRMLVPREYQTEVADIAKQAAESFVPGNPLDPKTRLGPLISADQRDRVRFYIERGISEGAQLLTGGSASPTGCERGYFVSPTIFTEVDNQMTIAREEIFGPVLSILPYRNVEQAIEIANDSPYGLAGAVWSSDEEQALSVARRLRTGQVDVNGGAFNPLAPFGGYKQSGNGREFGRFGLEEFLEIKSIQR